MVALTEKLEHSTTNQSDFAILLLFFTFGLFYFNRFAIALQSLCNRFAIALQSLCNRFAIALQSLCNRFAIDLVCFAIA
jgi:hypothetical protein